MEGACFTIVEYLLCGLPVLSTKPADIKGLGGRELWLNKSNSHFVEATAEKVAYGVEYLAGRVFDRHEIRRKLLMN